jgi:nucleotide-binding universal stress UspA family protein
MLKKILVPLDGSALAEHALGYAAELSIPTGATLLLVKAAYSHTMPGIDSRERKEGAIFEAQEYLFRTAAGLMKRGYSCETVAPYGHAADCILDQARLSKASLVVMTTHGRTGPGRLLFGSVAESVVAQSKVPVLAARGWLPVLQSESLLKDNPVFIVPLDGSTFAETALGPAIVLADDFGAQLQLVCAQSADTLLMDAAEYLAEVQARIAEQRPDVRTGMEVRFGNAAAAIDEAFRENGASLVVMATHGRGGVVRSVTGSVAGQVLKEGRAPLVLIHPPAFVEEIAREADQAQAEVGAPTS